jgi:ElaB/YqjD/DUF883 family membrane-anchored ribosome-binding protein
MKQSVLEQVGEQFDETKRKASRAASAVVDVFEDGVDAAKCAARHGGHVATELFDNTKRRVQRHPVETIVVTLAAGIAAGAAISWMMKRRQLAVVTD